MEEEEQQKLELKYHTVQDENGNDLTVDHSGTFTFRDEDHTLGNALRYMLARNRDVEFAGYSIPHPSDPVMNLRVQTNKNTNVVEALQSALSNLKQVCAHILETFDTEVALHSNPDEIEEAAQMET